MSSPCLGRDLFALAWYVRKCGCPNARPHRVWTGDRPQTVPAQTFEDHPPPRRGCCIEPYPVSAAGRSFTCHRLADSVRLLPAHTDCGSASAAGSAPDPSFHTPCFLEEVYRRRTEVVVGPVESVDSARRRSSSGVAVWGCPGSDSRMNGGPLWKPEICPPSILKSSSSSSSIGGLLCTYVCRSVHYRWIPRGTDKNSSRNPQPNPMIIAVHCPWMNLSVGTVQ